MYDEEVAKGTLGIPPRWRHARFLEELVYDFIFPKRSTNKSDDSTNTTLICSFSSFGQSSCDMDDDGGMYDLTCGWGRKTYLEEVPTQRIYWQAIKEGHFTHRLDGMRHNTIPCQKDSHCQWCYYKLMNEYIGRARKNMRKALGQNRQMIRQCLVCHVNLCPCVRMNFMGRTCPHTPRCKCVNIKIA
jgi:hypothetical protein